MNAPGDGMHALLHGLAASLDAQTAAIDRLREAVEAAPPGAISALAASALALAASAPARLTADLLVGAYRMIPGEPPAPRLRLRLVPGGAPSEVTR